MKKRIAECLDRCRRQGRPALIVYATVGCPDPASGELLIDRLIDVDVKYTFRFMQCTGRSALADSQTGALMVHMLSNAFYSGLFETIRHELSREDAIAYALRLRRFFRMGWADLLGMEKG